MAATKIATAAAADDFLQVKKSPAHRAGLFRFGLLRRLLPAVLVEPGVHRPAADEGQRAIGGRDKHFARRQRTVHDQRADDRRERRAADGGRAIGEGGAVDCRVAAESMMVAANGEISGRRTGTDPEIRGGKVRIADGPRTRPDPCRTGPSPTPTPRRHDDLGLLSLGGFGAMAHDAKGEYGRYESE